MPIKDLLALLINEKIRIIVRDKNNQIVIDLQVEYFHKDFIEFFNQFKYFNSFVSCLTNTKIIELKENDEVLK